MDSENGGKMNGQQILIVGCGLYGSVSAPQSPFEDGASRTIAHFRK